ncbi:MULTISPECIES: MATE family efflux transporter [unclassified Vibrio]|uniref:MATE family efflux transporter n=1 Tax=unclassified Vibrio TaxID=2614977 RepID=UPI0021BCA34F|nr:MULTISPECIES: MATE family efflux transporter [unclassified Vibrio]QXL80201.1 Multidrug export protein MepA [Vibrio sp.]
MHNKINLESENIKLLFLRYFWPALITVLIKAGVIMADGMFVGQGVGPIGLASIGLTMPLQAMFTALSLIVGIGGAALMSIEFGKGRFKEGQEVFNQSLVMILIVTCSLALLTHSYSEEILAFFGAEGNLMQAAGEYLSIMVIFYIFHVLVVVVTIFVINDENPFLPMFAMFLGTVAFIILGYVLIFSWSFGIKGAAYASVVAQIVMLLVLSIHFIFRQGRLTFNLVPLRFNRLKEILYIGSPTFFLELATIIVMLVFNYVLLNEYSENHLAAYGITVNLSMVLMLFLSSIGQACQPIFSFSLGKKSITRVRAVLKLGLIYSMTMGVLATLLVFYFAPKLVGLYIEQQTQVKDLALDATKFYFLAAVALGINLMSTTFFQAIKRPNLATIVSLSRGFVFILLGFLVLPALFPAHGIWLLTLNAELITCALSVVLLKRYFTAAN